MSSTTRMQVLKIIAQSGSVDHLQHDKHPRQDLAVLDIPAYLSLERQQDFQLCYDGLPSDVEYHRDNHVYFPVPVSRRRSASSILI